jgi:hypothetical protein
VIKTDFLYREDIVDGELLEDFCDIPKGYKIFVKVKGNKLKIRYCSPDNYTDDWYADSEYMRKTIDIIDHNLHLENKDSIYHI